MNIAIRPMTANTACFIRKPFVRMDSHAPSWFEVLYIITMLTATSTSVVRNNRWSIWSLRAIVL